MHADPTRLHMSRQRQRGAAALIVVLVLFFVVSMVAAYTSRSMIFEQRTSSNQYRSTQAFEAAEAGLEWGIALLNAGRITSACEPDPTGPNTFRERYLTIASGSGVMTGTPGLSPTCAFSPAAGWTCSCPMSGSTPAATSGAGPFMAFRLHFTIDEGATGSARAAAIRVVSHGCTGASENCLNRPQMAVPGEGSATVSALVGLKGAMTTIPAASLTLPSASTADPSLTLTSGSRVKAINAVAGGSGIAVHAGGTLPLADLELGGPPGAPSSLSAFESDVSLTSMPVTGGLRDSSDAGTCSAGATHPGCSLNRMFSGVFGTPRSTYLNQPALVSCTGVCNSAALSTIAANNPRSVILVSGSAVFDGDLGTATSPVAVLVDGTVTFSGAGTEIFGMVYSTSASWTVMDSPVLNGAAVAEQAVTLGGGGTLQLRYDPNILSMLRTHYGSFARVPGTWRDWQP